MQFQEKLYIDELGYEVVVPKGWSYNACRIFADKYLSPQDHYSIPAAICRVADAVAAGDHTLADRLISGLAEQRYSFNSPVWFNAGIEDNPQCSACFIQSIDDNMDSILELAVKEGQLFKYGSGTGTNLSPLRGSMEGLSGGGKASGPVSFMKVYDAVAGIVKSGGKTRRAAKMQILDCDHPDIREFIWCKAREERKASDLILKAGYDTSFDGEAYSSVYFQNANLSVRVTDEFMAAAGAASPWNLTARTTGETLDSLLASDLLRMMAEAAWQCGDPGIQYHDTINAWHTCPQDGPITASNPCSEYMFLPETACNLASLNLAAYLYDGDQFDVEAFVSDVYDLVTAMDNIIDLAGYPTELIAERSRRYRTLGLGYTNLAYVLSKLGLAYDSAAGRDWAASITALMHFAAQTQSSILAGERGIAEGVVGHHNNYMRVFAKHHEHLRSPNEIQTPIWSAAYKEAARAEAALRQHGARNAQLTVLAPTGTISFIMDCVTTGIEPLFARSMTKKLAGGGTMELQFDGDHIQTADEINPSDHLRMMAAVQPFLSGAISKTVNVPNDYTPAQIEALYVQGWRLGLKAVAVYRDGCKLSQPLTKPATEDLQTYGPERHPLPSTRDAITHKFSVAGHDGYLTVGLYEDGRPGELFIHVSREGSTISGLLDSWAITMSIALQHGVPLGRLVDKLAYQRFEPAGMSDNPEIPMAHSIIDYIARWLILRFEEEEAPQGAEGVMARHSYSELLVERLPYLDKMLDAAFSPSITFQAMAVQRQEKTCQECGGMLVRTGTCYTCPTCGCAGGCG